MLEKLVGEAGGVNEMDGRKRAECFCHCYKQCMLPRIAWYYHLPSVMYHSLIWLNKKPELPI
jgi:hypothetical protein